jgi:polynucleotide 5'-kinase involved in rRNA processing
MSSALLPVADSLSSRYQRVAFLECDPGQSEFTPGGMVALNLIQNPLFGQLLFLPEVFYVILNHMKDPHSLTPHSP